MVIDEELADNSLSSIFPLAMYIEAGSCSTNWLLFGRPPPAVPWRVVAFTNWDGPVSRAANSTNSTPDLDPLHRRAITASAGRFPLSRPLRAPTW